MEDTDAREGPRVGEQRPGGRAQRVRTAVMKAAVEVLREVGYDGVSVEEVARRAGVHKTTVYRRWTTKAALIADAVALDSTQTVPIPDTGTVHGDLRMFAREIVANMGSEGGARGSRSIVAAAASSDELATSMHAYWAERLALSSEIIERAVARGELAPNTDANLIIETVIGPLWVRLLLTGEPVTDDLADRVVDLVTAGALTA